MTASWCSVRKGSTSGPFLFRSKPRTSPSRGRTGRRSSSSARVPRTKSPCSLREGTPGDPAVAGWSGRGRYDESSRERNELVARQHGRVARLSLFRDCDFCSLVRFICEGTAGGEGG